MAVYTDSNKNEWPLDIVTRTVKEVKKNVKDADGQPVDLMSCVTGNLTFKLMTDPCLLVDILWTICKPYAETKGLTYDQFATAHKGEVLDAALGAFIEALGDFFPKPLKAALNQMFQKTKELQQTSIDAMVQSMDNALTTIQPATAQALREATIQNASGN